MAKKQISDYSSTLVWFMLERVLMMNRMTQAVTSVLLLALGSGTVWAVDPPPPPPPSLVTVHFEALATSSFTAPASVPLVVHATTLDTPATISSVAVYGTNILAQNLLGFATAEVGNPGFYDFNRQNVAAGNYTLYAVATDSNGNANTSVALAVTVNAAVTSLPTDLTVSALKITPSKRLDATPFTADVTVKNAGRNACSGGTLTVVPAVGAAGLVQTVPALAKSKSVKMTFAVPGQATGVQKMTATLSAVPGETKTTNNSKALTYTVTARPDFSITAVAFSKFPPLCKSNSKFTAYVTVLNAGGAAKAGYLDVWINYAEGQTFTKRVVVSTIAAGKTKRVTLSGLLTGVATGEQRTFRAVINSTKTTYESNEDNNVFTTTYTPCALTPSSAP